MPGINKGWGLSFMINRAAAPSGRSAGSLAWAGLPNTYFWIDRTRNVCGVFLAQTFPFGEAGALRAFEAFEQTVYACA
jgi:CubicO group peptidase (beta-lactamase class C family)